MKTKNYKMMVVILIVTMFFACDPSLIEKIIRGLDLTIDIILEAFFNNTNKTQSTEVIDNIYDDVELLNSVIKEYILFHLKKDDIAKITLAKLNYFLKYISDLNIDIKLKKLLQQIINNVLIDNIFYSEINIPNIAEKVVKSDTLKVILSMFEKLSSKLDKYIDSYKKPFEKENKIILDSRLKIKSTKENMYIIEWKYKPTM